MSESSPDSCTINYKPTTTNNYWLLHQLLMCSRYRFFYLIIARFNALLNDHFYDLPFVYNTTCIITGIRHLHENGIDVK